MSGARRWLVSPAFDLTWFLAPGLIACVLALIVGVVDRGVVDRGGETDSLALWIIGVLFVDVAHVWASLYRTYFDADARREHRSLLLTVPLVVAVLGFWAHAISSHLFWGALAYVAVFHFIKQQEGFAALYLRAGGETDPRDRQLTRAAIWATTAGPVIWWHGQLPRQFAWFVADDFIDVVPELIGTIAVWAQWPIALVFFARRLWLRARGRPGHPMVALIVALTALSWNMGIVWFNDDRVFTLTNVFLHGVPYIALVWVAGGREQLRARMPGAGPLVWAVGFYGLLVALAWGEEALWDRLVWHDHPQLFGGGELALGELGLAVAVALLTVPQATHYVLDRYIWRVGPRNPKLAGQLGFESN